MTWSTFIAGCCLFTLIFSVGSGAAWAVLIAIEFHWKKYRAEKLAHQAAVKATLEKQYLEFLRESEATAARLGLVDEKQKSAGTARPN